MRIVHSEWSRLQISASVGRMLVSVKIASKILHFSLSCEFVRKKTNISNLSNSFQFKRASQRFGSGSYSGSFNHKAKIIRILIPHLMFSTSFWIFIFAKWCKCRFLKSRKILVFRETTFDFFENVTRSVVDPYSFFPDPDPEFDVRDQYGSGSTTLVTRHIF